MRWLSGDGKRAGRPHSRASESLSNCHFLVGDGQIRTKMLSRLGWPGQLNPKLLAVTPQLSFPLYYSTYW
jgi:hypothetical protein